MRKILSAFFCFCLLAAFARGSAAEEPVQGISEVLQDAAVGGAVAAQETVSGGAGVTSAAEVAPAENVTASGPALSGGDSAGLSDMDIFRQKAADDPFESAKALKRLLGGKTREEINAFRRANVDTLNELMCALDVAASGNPLHMEQYIATSMELRPFGLRTPYFHRQHPVGGFGKSLEDVEYPTNEIDFMMRAHIAEEDGNTKDAEAALRAAVKTYPKNASVRVAVAAHYNKAKNFPLAEESATDAIELDAKDPDAYKARALARASLNNRKGAIADIKKAMAIDPQDESARVLAALLESRRAVTSLKSVSSVEEMKRALGAQGDSSEAVRGGAAGSVGGPGGGTGAEVRDTAPDFARSRAYLKTAVAKNRLGDYKSAAQYASMAIEKDPANDEARLERANAYNFLGRYDDAVRDAGLVIEHDPSNMQAYNMRAWSLNRKGQAGEAVTDASRAIGINPAYADAWFNRALAYEKQGDYKRMLEDFKQAASLSGAYSSRYQDAVAQYGPRVPGFAGAAASSRAQGAAERGVPPAEGRAPMQRFLMLMLFTLTGGGLVAAGLLHIMSSRSAGAAAPRATHPDVLSPSVFYEGVATGKYKIERKLGEGAMGVVYEATDQSLGRKVAIKKMGDEIKVNDREKQRFLEEARTVAQLHHPGIVEIYTIFEEEGDIYLVFEHVDGVTLDKVLDKEARIPFDRAQKMFGEAAAALSYAHSKNIVHRDLKLANMMLSAEGTVKVMDFGLAHRAMESMARLSNSEVVGSPAYMAPEQELGVSSAESDIYSLGVCLYEALSGVLPFQGPDFHHQKTHRAYQPLSQSVPGLPKAVDDVVARCLDPEPEKRFRDAEELGRALSLIV